MFHKICAICGKPFEGITPNSKYCSNVCRDRGARIQREEWEERTGYRDKKREEMRQRRYVAAERARPRMKSIDEIHVEHMQKLQLDAEAGNHYARATLARMNGDRAGFWAAYRDGEIAWAASFGKKSRRLVNGISVHSPDFVEAVIASIDVDGKCIQSLDPPREGYM